MHDWIAPGHVRTCDACGKRCFVSRKDARKYSRTQMPGNNWSIYKCGEYWHYGHKPADMKSGKRTRADYDSTRARYASRRKKLRTQLGRAEKQDQWGE